MIGKTKERWRELCEQAVVEQDPDRFLATIQELIQVLDENQKRRRNAPELPVLPVPSSQNNGNLSRPSA
jgi:hypothetical protein